MDELVASLVDPTATIAICGSIVIVASLWSLYVRWRLWRARRALTVHLEALSAASSGRDFTGAYEELSETFSRSELLGHAWTAFASTLILPSDPTDVCRYAEAPELYFNAEAMAGEALNIRLLHAMPNYLSGIGILGTFLGLAAGIYLASAGLASDVLAETTDALGELLKGAGLAFSTSIVGLGSSIVLSWADKISLGSLDRLVGRWNTALERRLTRATPEQLASEQLAEMRKQSLQLERFNTDLAVSIAEALDNRISESLSPKFNELVAGLRDLKGQQGEFSNSVLDRVSEQISEALSGAVGTEMREMANTLSGLGETLREASSTLSSGQQQLVDAADGLVARIHETFSQSATQMNTETIKAVQQIATNLDAAGQSTAEHLRQAGEDSSRRFGEAFVSIEGGVGKLSGAVEQLAGTVEQQHQLAERVSRLLSSLDGAHASLRSTVEPLTLATKSLSSAGAVLSERLLGLEGVVDALKQVASDTSTSQQQLQQIWGQYEQRFKGVDASLERAFRELNLGLEGFAERIKKFLIEIDRSLGQSVQGLSGIANEIESGVEALRANRSGE